MLNDMTHIDKIQALAFSIGKKMQTELLEQMQATGLTPPQFYILKIQLSYQFFNYNSQTSLSITLNLKNIPLFINKQVYYYLFSNFIIINNNTFTNKDKDKAINKDKNKIIKSTSLFFTF